METMTANDKILLVGGGGVPNYGDELILESWLRWYVDQRGVGGRGIHIEGGHHRVLYSLFQDRYPGVVHSSHIRKARIEPEPEFFASVAKGYGFMQQHPDHPLTKLIEGLDVYHLHGGGYLNDRWPTHGFMVGLGLAAKEHTGCRLVGTGLGLGPLAAPTADDTLAPKAFGAFDLLEVRDDWSRDYLVNNGLSDTVIRGLDDVFLQPPAAQAWERPTLHLSLRADATGASVAERLTSTFVGGFDRHVFWMGTIRDMIAYEQVSKRFPFFEVRSVHDLMRGFPSGPNDFMITQRFHPHLIGARAGMQGMYSSGSDYYDVKHGSVVELGSPFTALDLDALEGGRPAPVAGTLAARDAELVAQKRATASGIADGLRAEPTPLRQAGMQLGKIVGRLKR